MWHCNWSELPVIAASCGIVLLTCSSLQTFFPCSARWVQLAISAFSCLWLVLSIRTRVEFSWDSRWAHPEPLISSIGYLDKLVMPGTTYGSIWRQLRLSRLAVLSIAELSFLTWGRGHRWGRKQRDSTTDLASSCDRKSISVGICTVEFTTDVTKFDDGESQEPIPSGLLPNKPRIKRTKMLDYPKASGLVQTGGCTVSEGYPRDGDRSHKGFEQRDCVYACIPRRSSRFLLGELALRGPQATMAVFEELQQLCFICIGVYLCTVFLSTWWSWGLVINSKPATVFS